MLKIQNKDSELLFLLSIGLFNSLSKSISDFLKSPKYQKTQIKFNKFDNNFLLSFCVMMVISIGDKNKKISNETMNKFIELIHEKFTFSDEINLREFHFWLDTSDRPIFEKMMYEDFDIYFVRYFCMRVFKNNSYVLRYFSNRILYKEFQFIKKSLSKNK
jgi:hypothetical protein